MSPTLDYALLIGKDTSFLLHCFHYLANLQHSLQVTFYASCTPLERANIHLNFLQILYLQDYFVAQREIRFTWKSAAEAISIKPQTVFIPTPDNLIYGEGDVQIVVNDQSSNVIALCAQNKIPVNETLLQDILKTPIDYKWLSRRAWENTIYQHLLRLWQTPHIEMIDLPLFEFLQHCQLWKHGLHFHWRKEIQEPALRQLMQDPEHVGAHLVLSIFKRYYLDCPESLVPLINPWKQRHAGYLRIMPPLNQKALTYIVTTYNRPKSLKRALAQIVNQTVEQWFLSILDHGSGHETQHQIEQVKRQYPDRVKVYRHEKNTGPKAIFGHMQQLIKEAPTELICFCSDDDFVWKQHAEKTLDLFKQYPWISMAYGKKQIISIHNKPTPYRGAYYNASQIINPYIELQRIIPARSASPHFVIRKTVLRELHAIDPYIPAKAEYGLHDTLSHIFAIALYEVAYANDILSSVTSDPQSAFNQEDINSVWLLMAREVIQKYHALFEEDFPIQPVQDLLKALFKNACIRLWQDWESIDHQEAAQQALNTKFRFYQEAFAFKQHIFPLCSPTTPYLFQDMPPYVPIPWRFRKLYDCAKVFLGFKKLKPIQKFKDLYIDTLKSTFIKAFFR